MSNITPRSHPRVNHEAPIQFALLNSHQFRSTRMFNYSDGGLCYETDQPLALKEKVCIVMENYQPGQTGPEGFRSYLTQVRWTELISKNGVERYAAGAQWIFRSHDILATEAQLPHHICDLCGSRLPVHKLEQTTQGTQLCQACSEHFHNIPAGKIRQCVERFLLGNVI